jgi:hypothetical protein
MLKYHRNRRSAIKDLWFYRKRNRNPHNVRYRTFYYGICSSDGYWWQEDTKKWVPTEESRGPCGSHFHGCNSPKAFRRRLREWSQYLPEGIEFILCSRFDELNVIGKTTRPKT